jgi:hypothetical protein
LEANFVVQFIIKKRDVCGFSKLLERSLVTH